MKYLLALFLISIPLFAELESETKNLNCEFINTTVCDSLDTDCTTLTNDGLARNGLPRINPEGLTVSKYKAPDLNPLYLIKWGYLDLEATKMGNVLYSNHDGDKLENENFRGKDFQYHLNLVTMRYTYSVIDKNTKLKYLTQEYQCSETKSLFD